MTPEEGYERAKYMRPGVRIVMGPHCAVEMDVLPLSEYATRNLPGDKSWHDRDLRLSLGFLPSMWAKRFAFLAQNMGHDVTRHEWVWLHGPASLDKAMKWLDGISVSKSEKEA